MFVLIQVSAMNGPIGHLLSHLAEQLAFTVLGAIVGSWIPIMTFWWRYKRRRKGESLLGVWKSEYQGIDGSGSAWIKEELLFDTRLGRFYITNKDSTHDYKYTAFGDLSNKVHLVGSWTSKRPGATACGAFVLTLDSQGEFMYGYWVGPARNWYFQYRAIGSF
jgi:hypothetical protein